MIKDLGGCFFKLRDSLIIWAYSRPIQYMIQKDNEQ